MVTVLIVVLFVLNHGFWVNHVHPTHMQKNILLDSLEC